MTRTSYYTSNIERCFEEALKVREQDSKQRKLAMATKYARKYCYVAKQVGFVVNF